MLGLGVSRYVIVIIVTLSGQPNLLVFEIRRCEVSDDLFYEHCFEGYRAPRSHRISAKLLDIVICQRGNGIITERADLIE